MKWHHLAQFSGTIVSMPGSNHQIWLAGLLAYPYYQSSLSELSLIATLDFYVVLFSVLMYVDFNYRVNENFVSHRTLLRKTCYKLLSNKMSEEEKKKIRLLLGLFINEQAEGKRQYRSSCILAMRDVSKLSYLLVGSRSLFAAPRTQTLSVF